MELWQMQYRVPSTARKRLECSENKVWGLVAAGVGPRALELKMHPKWGDTPLPPFLQNIWNHDVSGKFPAKYGCQRT